MINLLKKIVLALFLGSLATIYIIQNQEDFKISVQEQLEELLKKTFECNFTCKIKNINLFSPSVEIEEIFVREDKNNKWKWKCKNFQFDCSWLDFLLNRKFKAKIIMRKAEFFSTIENGDVSIIPHIKKLILSNNSKVPIMIKELKIKKSSFQLDDLEYEIKSKIDFNCEIKNISDFSKIALYINDGSLIKQDIICANKISGNVQINISQSNIFKSTMEINGISDLPVLKIDNSNCFFSGKWTEKKKFFKVGTTDGKLSLECINFYIKKNKLTLDLIFQSSLQYLQKIFNFNVPNNSIDGDCILNISTDFQRERLKGECLIKNISNNKNSIPLEEIKLNFNKKLKKWFGVLEINDIYKNNFTANWNIEELQKFLRFTYNSFLEKNEKIVNSSGEILLSDRIKAKGNINKQRYEADCVLKPDLIIKNFSYFNDEGKKCVNVISKNNKLNIIVNFENIQNWLSDTFTRNLIGEGKIIIDGDFINNKFQGRIRSDNLNITLSKVYNIIKEIEGDIEIDLLNKNISINNTLLRLYKGVLECDNAKILFDNFTLSFVHMPLTIKNSLISWKKDIIANLSGKLLIKKVSNLPTNVSGFIFINSAQILNNIFSNEFKNEILAKNNDLTNKNQTNIDVDLSILSNDTIKVKTPFLNTKSKFDIRLFNNIYQPKISGSIDITKGSIDFPYRKLNIISGNINFLPDQLNDPIINLIAKNKIKNHNIIMNVTGSIQNHNIKFESSPPLSDEQIIALLLVGNEKGSFNMIMPTLVMKNVKNIVSGSSQTHKSIKGYFDKLLKPLKFIKLTPNYNSETGRPGFKGSINILNDRLRVELQKNFTLAEDTRFQIDYALTDEIKLKTTKDERGDLGGEIEMRWKF